MGLIKCWLGFDFSLELVQVFGSYDEFWPDADLYSY